jgi:ATP-binding cassette, subfamily B, bacterial PglK
MRQVKALKKILNYKEKIRGAYIAFLMIINAIFELMSIGLILPIMSILLTNNINFFPDKIKEYLGNLDYSILVIFMLSTLITMYVIKNLFIIFYNYQLGLFLKDLQVRVMRDLYQKYIYQNYLFFLQKKLGTILRNLDSARVVSLFLFSYLTAVLEVMVIILMLGYLVYLNPVATIIIAFIFSFFGSIMYLKTKKNLTDWSVKKLELESKILQQISQSFTLIKNIKIFNKEKKMYDFFNETLINQEQVGFKVDFIQQIPRALMEVLGVISMSVLIFVLSVNGKSTEEIIVVAAVYAAVAFRLIPSSTRIIAAGQRIKALGPALNLIKNEFINLEVSKVEDNKEKKNRIEFDVIELKDVSFKYDNIKIDTLSNINFKINKGEIIGIFGSSGSGKSTFINLISGLIDPTGGEIKINNENLQDLRSNWLSILGYVPQQSGLFNDTILKNISFFEDQNDNDIFNEKLNKALIQSNLKEFVETLPDKVNTEVGESAGKLSGGQVQRIGIARAMFNDPQFVIFDESTNSLDEKNEKSIMEFIYSLKSKKTVLIISHKEEILNKCDRIYKIENKNLKKIK